MKEKIKEWRSYFEKWKESQRMWEQQKVGKKGEYIHRTINGKKKKSIEYFKLLF